MAETSRSVRPIPLSDKRQPPNDTEVQVGSKGILFDNDGTLWITTLGDGLRRSPDPEFLEGSIKEFSTAVESFTAKDGLSDDVVLAILQDREGNIWVGTNNGLDRFRKTNLVPVVLPFKTVFAALAAGDDGDLFVANPNFPIVRVHGGRAYRDHPLPCGDAFSAYRDLAGAVWWVCLDAIYRDEARQYTRLALPPWLPKPYMGSAIEATEDGSGALWLAAEGEGLFYRKKGGWQRLESALELAKSPPTTAFTDWMGRAWFGYDNGTIILLRHENIQRVFPANDSPVGAVRAINGRGRHTWAGGDLGLAFFDGNRFRRIVPADAETFGSVMGVEETLDGSLWLTESRGIIQVPASEVRQAVVNPSYRVNYRVFDSFDGLPGTFAGTRRHQKQIQTTDGRLWFNSSGGVAWIDPANISTNDLPPPVLINSVKANGRESGPLANLTLPPRTTNLQLGYTALSLAIPERVRFRYRLEGVDKDWQDAGTRREALYTRLGPGEYHFRVIACNNDGVWNEAGSSLDFRIAPAWYQTYWFLALCAAIIFLIVWALYRMRLQQVAKAMSVRFDDRLSERTRIARDLHDTLLQTIQGSKLVADSALKQSSDPSRMHGALEQLSVWLERATEEGRVALNSLRTSTTETNDLAEAFRRAIEECRIENSIESSFSVVGDAREMHPIVRDEVYRIGYEAIRNACVHSQANKLQVTLTYSEDLGVRVSDNGVGIDPSVADRGKDGHFGLRGMRERAARIAGKLTVTGSPSSGTEVKLVVPGKIIYRNTTSDSEHSKVKS
jgi:signal transduction histidine kinase/streptogramin lyase